MPAESISFRVAYEGPLTEFTRRNPDAAISIWCDWNREVVEVGGAAPEAVDALKSDLAKCSGWMEAYPLDPASQVLILACIGLPHDFVYEAVDASHCLNLGPTRFADGWEHYDIVSFHEERSRDLFRRLKEGNREVELLARKPLRVQPILNTAGFGPSAILSGLTDRQADAVLLAHRHGLYASPRRTTAAKIADAVNLSRSTFEEHLRKAEHKLMANLVPYLELQQKQRRGTPDARMTYAAT